MRKFLKITTIVLFVISILLLICYISKDTDMLSWLRNMCRDSSALENGILLASLISLILSFIFMLLAFRKYGKDIDNAIHKADISTHIAKTVTLKAIKKQEEHRRKEQEKQEKREEKKQKKISKKTTVVTEEEVVVENVQPTFHEEHKELPNANYNQSQSKPVHHFKSSTNSLLDKLNNGKR